MAEELMDISLDEKSYKSNCSSQIMTSLSPRPLISSCPIRGSTTSSSTRPVNSTCPSRGGVSKELRKTNKPLMEKRRRERINACLEELKIMLMDVTKNKECTFYSKLEKADILEMTVNYLRTTVQSQRSKQKTTSQSEQSTAASSIPESCRSLAPSSNIATFSSSSPSSTRLPSSTPSPLASSNPSHLTSSTPSPSRSAVIRLAPRTNDLPARYREGFNKCANEVNNFLTSVTFTTGSSVFDLDLDFRTKLLEHLAERQKHQTSISNSSNSSNSTGSICSNSNNCNGSSRCNTNNNNIKNNNDNNTNQNNYNGCSSNKSSNVCNSNSRSFCGSSVGCVNINSDNSSSISVGQSVNGSMSMGHGNSNSSSGISVGQDNVNCFTGNSRNFSIIPDTAALPEASGYDADVNVTSSVDVRCPSITSLSASSASLIGQVLVAAQDGALSTDVASDRISETTTSPVAARLVPALLPNGNVVYFILKPQSPLSSSSSLSSPSLSSPPASLPSLSSLPLASSSSSPSSPSLASLSSSRNFDADRKPNVGKIQQLSACHNSPDVCGKYPLSSSVNSSELFRKSLSSSSPYNVDVCKKSAPSPFIINNSLDVSIKFPLMVSPNYAHSHSSVSSSCASSETIDSSESRREESMCLESSIDLSLNNAIGMEEPTSRERKELGQEQEQNQDQEQEQQGKLLTSVVYDTVHETPFAQNCELRTACDRFRATRDHNNNNHNNDNDDNCSNDSDHSTVTTNSNNNTTTAKSRCENASTWRPW